MKVTVMVMKTVLMEASTLMNTKDTLSTPAELAGRQIQTINWILMTCYCCMLHADTFIKQWWTGEPCAIWLVALALRVIPVTWSTTVVVTAVV